MRVLFTPFPAVTHVHTQVPLAWALRTAGHDVCFAGQPDVLSDMRRSGLPAVTVGPALDLAATMGTDEPPDAAGPPADDDTGDWLDVLDISELLPQRLTGEYAQGVLAAWTYIVYQATTPREVIDELVEFCRWWRPDLVLWDTMGFAGPVAAMACGAAHGRVLFGLDLLGHLRQVYLRRRLPALRDDPLREWLAPMLADHGREFAEEVVVGQFTVDPVPSSLRLPVAHPYVPMRYVPYNGTAEVPRWLRQPPGHPRVCVTLGSSFRDVMGGDRVSVAELLDAVADLNVEVVATLDTSQLVTVGRVPPNVRVTRFVPLDVLLPSCAAIVHHGGSGTVVTALAHGVPQVMIASRIWCNQPKAAAVARAGAGVWAEAGTVNTTELRRMLLRVIEDPSFAAAAARLRREMQGTPTPRDLVGPLERLTDAHRTRS